MAFLNVNGDSFLNKCFHDNRFFGVVSRVYTPVYGWTEPYPLLLLLLILLIVLPAIFKFCSQGIFLKIYRLYNIIRLGLLSLLHQITYSYTIQTPLSLLVQQQGPCYKNDDFATRVGDLQFPFSPAMSASLFIFTVARFSGINKYKTVLYTSLFLTPMVIFVVGSDFGSFFQVFSSIPISYILHFIHIHLPFRWIHLENAIICIINIIFSILLCVNRRNEIRAIAYLMLFPFAVQIIDEIMLIRHQITRGGFAHVERPADLSWTTETQHSESLRLLNSDEEDNFDKNLNTDITTAFIAFFLFFVSVLARQLIVTVSFFQPPS